MQGRGKGKGVRGLWIPLWLSIALLAGAAPAGSAPGRHHQNGTMTPPFETEATDYACRDLVPSSCAAQATADRTTGHLTASVRLGSDVYQVALLGEGHAIAEVGASHTHRAASAITYTVTVDVSDWFQDLGAYTYLFVVADQQGCCDRYDELAEIPAPGVYTFSTTLENDGPIPSGTVRLRVGLGVLANVAFSFPSASGWADVTIRSIEAAIS